VSVCWLLKMRSSDNDDNKTDSLSTRDKKKRANLEAKGKPSYQLRPFTRGHAIHPQRLPNASAGLAGGTSGCALLASRQSAPGLAALRERNYGRNLKRAAAECPTLPGCECLRVSFEGECAKWREESYDSEHDEPGASSQNRYRPASIDKPHAILCNTDQMECTERFRVRRRGVYLRWTCCEGDW
jgi:hypothetical protein